MAEDSKTLPTLIENIDAAIARGNATGADITEFYHSLSEIFLKHLRQKNRDKTKTEHLDSAMRDLGQASGSEMPHTLLKAAAESLKRV